MKTIILATGFSKNAKRAAYFAAHLAKEHKARLTLFHAFQFGPDNPASTGNFPLSIDVVRQSCEVSLQRLANEIRIAVNTQEPIQQTYRFC